MRFRYSPRVSPGNVTVAMQVSRALPPAEQAAWDSLTPEFAQEVPDPQRVQLVITDRYEQIAGAYAVQSSTRSNTTATAADYRAAKPDGAMAVAKTIDLPNDEVVVVASTGLIRLGHQSVRRVLLHEAQHVRLHQYGDSAMAVHRRVTFELPGDLQWEFVWLAESLVDEFRCERAMHEKGLGSSDAGSVVDDYPGIVALFDTVRRNYHRAGDLMAAYHGSFAALDRLGTFLAYGAACIVLNPGTAEAWMPVPSMAKLLDIVSNVSAPAERVPDVRLTAVSVEVARMLRGTFQEMGFDLYFLPDTSRYFELLR
jgi:hypothetical protein